MVFQLDFSKAGFNLPANPWPLERGIDQVITGFPFIAELGERSGGRVFPIPFPAGPK